MNFPAPVAVALADALNWPASPGWTYETKLDGCRALFGNGELLGRACAYPLPGAVPPALAGCVLDGELCGETFFAFDVLEVNGQDLRQWPLRERKGRLAALQASFPPWIQPVPSERPGVAGGDYLRGVLAAGGEGICRKDLSAPYGVNWHKAKRTASFDVIVTNADGGKLSVAIGQFSNARLVDCGRVAVFNLAVRDNLKAGDVLEISAECRHASGAFRSPRFVRVRTDKPACDCTIERIEP